MTSCGFSARRSSYEQPQFAMTPAPKFSMDDVAHRGQPAEHGAPIVAAHLDRDAEHAAGERRVHRRVGRARRFDRKRRGVVERLGPDVRRPRPGLDLHDLGPERGEDLRAVVAGDEVPQREDANALEGPRRPRRRPTTCTTGSLGGLRPQLERRARRAAALVFQDRRASAPSAPPGRARGVGRSRVARGR